MKRSFADFQDKAKVDAWSEVNTLRPADFALESHKQKLVVSKSLNIRVCIGVTLESWLAGFKHYPAFSLR